MPRLPRALRDHLVRERRAGVHVLALLDPARIAERGVCASFVGSADLPAGRPLWPEGDAASPPWLVHWPEERAGAGATLCQHDLAAFTAAWHADALVGVLARAPLEVTWRHLRRFTQVRDPEGRIVSWRFHDPRVLRIALPVLTVAQRLAFFGPVQAWLTPDGERAGAATAWMRRGDQLVAETLRPDEGEAEGEGQGASDAPVVADDALTGVAP